MLHAGQEGDPSSRKTKALLWMTANGAAATALKRPSPSVDSRYAAATEKQNQRRDATRLESWHGESPAMA
jgi:hypothetical protein